MPQFRKGQSGNPAGRPPGSRNRATSMVQNLLEGAAENIAKRAARLAPIQRPRMLPEAKSSDDGFRSPAAAGRGA